MDPVAVALRFVDRINASDIDGLAALMTNDHRFTDSLGTEFTGKEKMRQGWQTYFSMVPDYRIEVQETFAEESVVVLLGIARGTYSRDGSLRPDDTWRTPGAWRAKIVGNQVAEWQVYADNGPIRQRLSEGLGS